MFSPRVIIANPSAGRGRAARALATLAAHGWDVQRTTAPAHATTLAENAANAGAQLVVAAGGDGTVHEVANGLLRAANADAVLGVWPVGSANDYAHALGVDGHWLTRPDPFAGLAVRRVDVGRIVADTGRVGYTVNCLGLGFNSAVTLEARSIRGLRGMALYGLAFLRAVWRHYAFPPLTVERDGVAAVVNTLALSVNVGRREGGFLVTPDAKLDDGLFDYVHAGPIPRWRALTMLPRIATGTLPKDHPLLQVGTCQRIHVRSETPLRVHADGEFFCEPADGVRELTVELLPRRLAVLART